MKLKDRVAIVTGAAQGIGRAIAEKLDAEGAKVVVADQNAEGAEQAADVLERGEAVEVDVSSEESVGAMADKVVDEHGRIDALVNNAAIVPFIPWDEVDLEHWRKIIDTNLTGVFLCVRAVQTPMREAGYGRIVNIASNTVLAGTPNMAAYVAAKGGVWGFTRALATELGADGVTVNAVAPGLTATEGVLDSPHKEAFEFVQSLQAIPRRGESEDIAPTVAFLCSEEAGWVTGQMIAVDGGHTRH
ncbi:MAG: short-chain dehydrogenase/reductase [Solirubrobacterales bacterium]|jgi:NAD(P)-dependent dehydrogenase (short-subunit alcohol dehydrogenase family)|nr:short-chain dehydrogenase/reductase [Solirubrobacterales bacterium]